MHLLRSPLARRFVVAMLLPAGFTLLVLGVLVERSVTLDDLDGERAGLARQVETVSAFLPEILERSPESLAFVIADVEARTHARIAFVPAGASAAPAPALDPGAELFVSRAVTREGRTIGVVHASLPVTSLAAQRRDLHRDLAAAACAAAFGAVVIALLLSRIVVRPILRVSDAVRSFAGGDRARRVDDESARGELRELGAAFNEMASNLGSLHAELERRATRDVLTGVWNRGAALEALTEHAERGDALSIVLVDLDHFKRINDEHGHLAGDAVLREAARRLERAVRPCDVVGRYGGEEFLVVLPGCDPADAVAIAERLRHEVGAAPIELPSSRLRVTASLGVAGAAPAEATEALIARADDALYAAKRQGRDRVAQRGFLTAAPTTIARVTNEQVSVSMACMAPGTSKLRATR